MNQNPFRVVRDFEQALCEYTGAPYAVTTTSCTMALTLAVAWHLRSTEHVEAGGVRVLSRKVSEGARGPEPLRIEIPKRTYVGVPYAIREAGGQPVFNDEMWRGFYQLKPLPVWDSARWFTGGLYEKGTWFAQGFPRLFICVSFHWSKTLGIQQGGAILHDDPEADLWFRRARFDGRREGVPPNWDVFPLARAWHAYMSPEVAAEGLVRLSFLPKDVPPLPNDDYPDLSTLAVFK